MESSTLRAMTRPTKQQRRPEAQRHASGAKKFDSGFPIEQSRLCEFSVPTSSGSGASEDFLLIESVLSTGGTHSSVASKFQLGGHTQSRGRSSRLSSPLDLAFSFAAVNFHPRTYLFVAPPYPCSNLFI